MAAKSSNNSGRSKSSANSRNNSKSSGRTGTSARSKAANTRAKKDVKNIVTVDDSILDEAVLLCILAFCILVYLALFGALGSFGEVLSKVMFGIFGIISYIIPLVVFLSSVFYVSNKGRGVAYIKVISALLLAVNLCALSELLFDRDYSADKVTAYFTHCAEDKCGGGFIGSLLEKLLTGTIGTAGTYILIIILCIVFIVLITEKSFFTGVKVGSETIYNSARDNSERYREYRDERKRQREEYIKNHPEDTENKKRREKTVSGVTLDTKLQPGIDSADDIHEIGRDDFANINIKTMHAIEYDDDFTEITADDSYNSSYSDDYDLKSDVKNKGNDRRSAHGIYIHEPVISDVTDDDEITEISSDNSNHYDADFDKINISGAHVQGHGAKRDVERQTDYGDSYSSDDYKPVAARKPVRKSTVYKFPPLSMLNKSTDNDNLTAEERKKKEAEINKQLKQTAALLKNTLATFGVNVEMTDIEQGPSVTRYEMKPEVGTKVSKITNLQDDIKLSMAARDIRIEAPIPGKAAVGIEIPNKEVSTVAFRDLLEHENFKNATSKISFAVGKNLSGDTVVADIAKMPHMLIAGATGSGKSVCINTLIMSIIYKARPDEVKLIMVDPKVVELSVYNGIPHLMIPVVTDPKKAAAALNWGVAEMSDRYQKFAEFGVRDLKGYNKKLEAKMQGVPASERIEKLPQIVIIVDELADLMMVAKNEVESAICRLAQLARAAGIHLILATQRPSVDVITGLIKANMPSRIAFSVSSGIDSRTILDMNGAERLLGKGDMLFYPQGYTKPARVQGAFISDEEIIGIVEFLKANAGGEPQYDESVIAKVNSGANGGDTGATVSSGGAADNDEYFIEAARLAIDQEKASIGYFQRKFKIGFNRAARIMDQLYEAGIVAAEEGTKPRRVLMSMEEFENRLEQGEF